MEYKTTINQKKNQKKKLEKKIRKKNQKKIKENIFRKPEVILDIEKDI